MDSYHKHYSLIANTNTIKGSTERFKINNQCPGLIVYPSKKQTVATKIIVGLQPSNRIAVLLFLNKEHETDIVMINLNQKDNNLITRIIIEFKNKNCLKRFLNSHHWNKRVLWKNNKPKDPEDKYKTKENQLVIYTQCKLFELFLNETLPKLLNFNKIFCSPCGSVQINLEEMLSWHTITSMENHYNHLISTNSSSLLGKILKNLNYTKHSKPASKKDKYKPSNKILSLTGTYKQLNKKILKEKKYDYLITGFCKNALQSKHLLPPHEITQLTLTYYPSFFLPDFDLAKEKYLTKTIKP